MRYQPTRLRSSTAFRCSLRRSRVAWSHEARITKTVKKITTPSEKKVTILSSVSPYRPSPLSPAKAVAAGISQAARTRTGASFRMQGERYPVAWRGRLLQLHRRDPEGKPQQVRVRPRDGLDQARPFPVLVGRLSNGLRLRPGHALARRRSAGRHGARVRADLPRLHDRGEADRTVPHGGRPGDRRQGARGAAHGPGLEHARGPR